MPEIVMRFDGGLKQWRKYAADLTKGKSSLKSIHIHAAGKFAQFLQRKVQQAYRTSKFQMTEGTLEAYARPAGWHRGLKSAGSLNRSGHMISSIEVHRHRNNTGYTVRIDPSAVYSNGKSVARIAAQQEFGREFSFTLSKGEKERKWLAYLHILRPGDKGKYKSGQTVIVKKTPRPIWGPTHEKIPKWRHVYMRAVQKFLRQKRIRPVPIVK